MTEYPEPEEPAMLDVAERTEHEAPEVLGRADLSPAQWAERVAQHLSRAVAEIIAVGRELLAAKASLPHGSFEAMVDTHLAMGMRTAECYMAVARHRVLANPHHGSHLPPSWRTLYELSRIEPDALEAGITAGRVTADMERGDALALRRPVDEVEGGDPAEAPFPTNSPYASWRQGKCDALVELGNAKLLERNPIAVFIEVIGVTRDEVIAAARRQAHMADVEEHEAAIAGPKRLPKGALGPAPEGEKWCIRGQHFVEGDAVHFGVNVRRPDGLSDWCRECWRSYWAEREGKPDEREAED